MTEHTCITYDFAGSKVMHQELGKILSKRTAVNRRGAQVHVPDEKAYE